MNNNKDDQSVGNFLPKQIIVGSRKFRSNISESVKGLKRFGLLNSFEGAAGHAFIQIIRSKSKFFFNITSNIHLPFFREIFSTMVKAIHVG